MFSFVIVNYAVMKKPIKTTLRFYQNLGKLFYAIAAVDKNVETIEFDKLKEIVKSQWLDFDDLNDAFDSDAAYQIEFVFDLLNREENLDSKNCYNDFVTYKNTQKHLFTQPVKKLILETSIAIASSFSGRNKSELILLAKLEIELKKSGL